MLYLRWDSTDCIWGVWKVEESNDELVSMLTNISELKTNVFSFGSEKRIGERLAVRVLLKVLLGDEPTICYKDSGKPYFENGGYNLSISDTKGYVAVGLHKDVAIGIDIERIVDKVKRIRDKFVSPMEFIDPDREMLHLLLHWSAKESLYKIIDREGISFQNELRISRFTPEEKGAFCGYEGTCEYKIDYIVDSEFVLTIAVGNSKNC